MARDKTPRYATIRFDDEELPNITGASIKIRTNIPVSFLTALDDRNIDTLVDFLTKVITEWDGFDAELSKAEIADLEIPQIRQMANRIIDAIQTPQKATSAASL